MVFEISTARKEILEKLTEDNWTPNELSKELDKSRQSIYNHLNDLEQAGVLNKKKVTAKTRPETEYSIGDGFIQYVSVLPGNFSEKYLKLDETKKATVQIWNLPQENFHPYVEELWQKVRKEKDNLKAVAVFGSVATGEADHDSDIDILLVVTNRKKEFEEAFGSVRIDAKGETKLIMSEIYTQEEYRNSRVHGSQFLKEIQDELHPLYDPEGVLQKPLNSFEED